MLPNQDCSSPKKNLVLYHFASITQLNKKIMYSAASVWIINVKGILLATSLLKWRHVQEYKNTHWVLITFNHKWNKQTAYHPHITATFPILHQGERKKKRLFKRSEIGNRIQNSFLCFLPSVTAIVENSPHWNSH